MPPEDAAREKDKKKRKRDKDELKKKKAKRESVERRKDRRSRYRSSSEEEKEVQYRSERTRHRTREELHYVQSRKERSITDFERIKSLKDLARRSDRIGEWYFDPQGDKDNILYEGIYSRNVPRYVRVAFERRTTRKKLGILRPRDRVRYCRLRGVLRMRRLAKETIPIVRSSGPAEATEMGPHEEGFLALPSYDKEGDIEGEGQVIAEVLRLRRLLHDVTEKRKAAEASPFNPESWLHLAEAEESAGRTRGLTEGALMERRREVMKKGVAAMLQRKPKAAEGSPSDSSDDLPTFGLCTLLCSMIAAEAEMKGEHEAAPLFKAAVEAVVDFVSSPMEILGVAARRLYFILLSSQQSELLYRQALASLREAAAILSSRQNATAGDRAGATEERSREEAALLWLTAMSVQLLRRGGYFETSTAFIQLMLDGALAAPLLPDDKHRLKAATAVENAVRKKEVALIGEETCSLSVFPLHLRHVDVEYRQTQPAEIGEGEKATLDLSEGEARPFALEDEIEKMISEAAQKATSTGTEERGGEDEAEDEEEEELSEDEEIDSERGGRDEAELEAAEQGWEQEEEKEVVICGFCGDTDAIVRCLECEDAFCGRCSNRIHAASKATHTLISLNESVEKAKEERRRRQEQEEAERVAEQARRWKTLRAWSAEEALRRGAGWRRFLPTKPLPPLTEAVVSTLGESVVVEENSINGDDLEGFRFCFPPSWRLSSVLLSFVLMDGLRLMDGAFALFRKETVGLCLPSLLNDPFARWALSSDDPRETAVMRSPLLPLFLGAKKEEDFSERIEKEENEDKRQFCLRMISTAVEELKRQGTSQEVVQFGGEERQLSSILLQIGIGIATGSTSKGAAEQMRQFAKEALKKRRSDVELWMSYAAAEAIQEEREANSLTELTSPRRSLRIIEGAAVNAPQGLRVSLAFAATITVLRCFREDGSSRGRNRERKCVRAVAKGWLSSLLSDAVAVILSCLLDEKRGGMSKKGTVLLKARNILAALKESSERRLRLHAQTSLAAFADGTSLSAEGLLAGSLAAASFGEACYLEAIIGASIKEGESPVLSFEQSALSCLRLVYSLPAQVQRVARVGLLFALRAMIGSLMYLEGPPSRSWTVLCSRLFSLCPEDPYILRATLLAHFAGGPSPVFAVLPREIEALRRSPSEPSTPIVFAEVEAEVLRDRQLERGDRERQRSGETDGENAAGKVEVAAPLETDVVSTSLAIAGRLEATAGRGLGVAPGSKWSPKSALLFGRSPPSASYSLPYRLLLPALLHSAKPAASVRLLFRAMEVGGLSSSLFVLPLGLEKAVKAEEAEAVVQAMASKGMRRRTELEEAELIAEDQEEQPEGTEKEANGQGCPDSQ